MKLRCRLCMAKNEGWNNTHEGREKYIYGLAHFQMRIHEIQPFEITGVHIGTLAHKRKKKKYYDKVISEEQ